MNQSGTAPEVKYDGFELSPDSMDGYLKVKVAGSAAKIQFRSFGGKTSLTGWQGEVKGASANQGKISYGPINLILKNHSVTQIKANAAADAKRNDDSVATQIAKGMIELGALSGKTKDHVMMIKSKSDKWRYSKLQVVQLLIYYQESVTRETQSGHGGSVFICVQSVSILCSIYEDGVTPDKVVHGVSTPVGVL